MAYRFKLKESLREGVRRIAIEQIDKALESPHKGNDRPNWVHETRKTMKRMRALLRCVRSGLADSVFQEENAALADIARGLSGLRDSHVIADTIKALSDRGAKVDAALAWLSSTLGDQPTAGKAATSSALSAKSQDVAVRQAIKALEKAKARLAKLELEGELADIVGRGLRTAQQRGQRALHRLAAEVSDENLHELRKAVQTYQRQQTLIFAVWPELQNVRIEAARAVAQMLGEAQDLAVLASVTKAHSEGADAEEAEHGERLIAACRERQDEIRVVALPMAGRLFLLRPKAVEREFKAGWQAASELSAAGNARRGARSAAV